MISVIFINSCKSKNMIISVIIINSYYSKTIRALFLASSAYLLQFLFNLLLFS